MSIYRARLRNTSNAQSPRVSNEHIYALVLSLLLGHGCSNVRISQKAHNGNVSSEWLPCLPRDERKTDRPLSVWTAKTLKFPCRFCSVGAGITVNASCFLINCVLQSDGFNKLQSFVRITRSLTRLINHIRNCWDVSGRADWNLVNTHQSINQSINHSTCKRRILAVCTITCALLTCKVDDVVHFVITATILQVIWTRDLIKESRFLAVFAVPITAVTSEVYLCPRNVIRSMMPDGRVHVVMLQCTTNNTVSCNDRKHCHT